MSCLWLWLIGPIQWLPRHVTKLVFGPAILVLGPTILGGTVLVLATAPGYSALRFLCDELRLSIACSALHAYTPSDDATGSLGGFASVSSGQFYYCGLRESGRIACFSHDGEVLPAPRGRFRAISAGTYGTCAVRTNDGVVCWNSDDGRISDDTPTGKYQTVDIGGFLQVCALRNDGAAVCWDPRSGDIRATPEGRYLAVGASSNGACAIRDGSREIVCWGLGIDGFPSHDYAPSGRFTALSLYNRACALREDDLVVCWSPENPQAGVTPVFWSFSSISVGNGHACGLLTNGRVHCWLGGGSRIDLNPTVRYKSISAGYNQTCAVRASNGKIDCAGESLYGVTDTPPGRFVSISTDDQHVCALQLSGEVMCWGRNDYGQTEVPGGRYVSLSVGELHSCAVEVVTGHLKCWGDNRHGQLQTPDGRYSAVSASDDHSCALELDGSVECWGRDQYGETNAPVGQFIAIDTDQHGSCAIRVADYGAECWGMTWANQKFRYNQRTEAPVGQYVAIRAGWTGWTGGCALRIDGAILCWGSPINPEPRLIGEGYANFDIRFSNLCATTSNGKVACLTNEKWHPRLKDISMQMIALGEGYICGVRSDSEIVCEGRDGIVTPTLLVAALLAKKPELPGRHRRGRIRARRLRDGRIQIGFWFVAEGEPAALANPILHSRSPRLQSVQYVGPVVRGDETWGYIGVRWINMERIELGFGPPIVANHFGAPVVWLSTLPMPLTGAVSGWTQNADGWYESEEFELQADELDPVVHTEHEPEARDPLVTGGEITADVRISRRDGSVWARRVRRRKGQRRERG